MTAVRSQARMLPHHLAANSKPSRSRHADVDQDDGDLVLQQHRRARLVAGRDLDQVLAKLLQDRFVGEQLSPAGRPPAGC